MKMGSFLYQENNHGIMGKDEEHGGGSNSSSSSDLSSGSGSDSDLFEEVNSSSSSSLSSSASSSPPTRSKDALHDMSSLLQELPIKRGLSKHYNGRSQSFTSLSNVRSLEDLAKPEHPYNKKLKTCKSYQAFYENNNNNHGYSNDDDHLQTAVPTTRRSCNTSTKLIKKSSSSSTRGGGSCSSLCTKRNGSFNIGINRPPLIPPLPPLHKSDSSRNTSFNSQSPLFALGV